MSSCIILGSRSEIGMGLADLLLKDGWVVDGWARSGKLPYLQWNLCIIAMGTVAPVGLWHEVDQQDWEESIRSNILIPIKLLRQMWKYRLPDASICFMAGSNPNMIMDGYSAYNVGKMALLKAVEQLDHETQDAKFFAIGPGICDTKIHKATLEANWPNRKLEEARREMRFTPIKSIYDCLKWCIAQPKSIIGGRNICVSDPWDQGWLPEWLETDPSLFKLRRKELRLPKQ